MIVAFSNVMGGQKYGPTLEIVCVQKLWKIACGSATRRDTAPGRVVVFVGFGKLNLCDDAYQQSQEQDVHYKGKRRPLLLPLFVV